MPIWSGIKEFNLGAIIDYSVSDLPESTETAASFIGAIRNRFEFGWKLVGN